MPTFEVTATFVTVQDTTITTTDAAGATQTTVSSDTVTETEVSSGIVGARKTVTTTKHRTSLETVNAYQTAADASSSSAVVAPASSASPGTPDVSQAKAIPAGVIAGIVGGMLAACVLVGVLLFLVRRRRRLHKTTSSGMAAKPFANGPGHSNFEHKLMAERIQDGPAAHSDALVMPTDPPSAQPRAVRSNAAMHRQDLDAQVRGIEARMANLQAERTSTRTRASRFSSTVATAGDGSEMEGRPAAEDQVNVQIAWLKEEVERLKGEKRRPLVVVSEPAPPEYRSESGSTL